MSKWFKCFIVGIVTIILEIIAFSSYAGSTFTADVCSNSAVLDISNIEMVKRMPGDDGEFHYIYYAKAPVTVTITGSSIYEERILYKYNYKIKNNKLLTGSDDYAHVKFNKYYYKRCKSKWNLPSDDSETFDGTLNPPDLDEQFTGKLRFLSGNYATLTEPGIYVVGLTGVIIKNLSYSTTSPNVCYIYVTEDASSKTVLKTALPMKSKILLDGKEINSCVFNVDGSCYIKLLDFAKVLSGTTKHFNITRDYDKNCTKIESNKPLTDISSINNLSYLMETAMPTTEQTTSESITKVIVDNKEMNFSGYMISGYKYYKLRDLCKLLDISIGWDAKTKEVLLFTTK